jgi:predicted transcriptional regulator of viral defense system
MPKLPPALARLFRLRPLVRPRDLEAVGLEPRLLYTLTEQGLLVRKRRGLYTLPDHTATAQHNIATVAKLVPQAILCLHTALRLHRLTDQTPAEVWFALDRKSWRPSIKQPRVHIVRYSGPALEDGIETITIEGLPVRITSPARTIADCFKYRHKIGIDIALAALRTALRKKKVTVDDLWDAAETCRVARIMRPYLEAIVL